MALITEAEARENNLPGCDVFIRSQLAYKDNLNRDHFVVSLNREAFKIFKLTVTFGQYSQLKAQAESLQKKLAEGSFNFADYQISAEQWKLIEYMNLEFFYIATGFELHFKAWLLQNDYVVNIIDKNEPFKTLREQQKTRPIKKSELLAIKGFYYDTNKQKNILQGVTEQSLSFSTICNYPEYVRALNTSADIIGMVEDYRNLRNQIHLPGDSFETPTITRIGEKASELLINFINERVVEISNSINSKYNFNFSLLIKL